MKLFKSFSIVLTGLSLISCGQKSLVPLTAYENTPGTPSAISNALSNTMRRGAAAQANNSFYSGWTGSPMTNNIYAPNTGLASANSGSGIDLFGLSNQNSVSDPQQCANNYLRYPRFQGNFDAALAELATCLNRAMINSNPTVSQQYQALQQPYYYSGYSGYSF